MVEMVAGRSPHSPRRVLWLIEWLGEGSAFVASCRGGPAHRAWQMSTVLAAGQLNALLAANWQRGGGKGPKPVLINPPSPRQGNRQTLRDWRTRLASITTPQSGPGG